MIKLLEHEGKAILARCGIPIPQGALYRDLPQDLDGNLVVKTQILAGGRGKAGGIQFAATRAEALAQAQSLATATIAGAKVAEIYIERRLDIAQEYYVAALVDRDLGMPVLLASADGGIEIESVPPTRIIRQPVDPLIGLQPFMTGRITRALNLTPTQAEPFTQILQALYAALLSQDAELIEINPLALTADGQWIAADAKVMLDEDAAFRHPGRRATPEGTQFELECRQMGVIGIDLGAPGGIAAIMNGAGLTMATLDEITALGGPIAGLVELHGAAMNGPEKIAEIIECVLRHLAPATLLINVHFQFRSLVTIAEGLIRAMQTLPALTPDRLVLRLRGEKEAEARAILEPAGCTVHRDFAPACAQAVR